ncbi:MAG: YraN family protein [Proteobacteria bacterium]|nr:YraN family protein [Pseudomonadota bacterium]
MAKETSYYKGVMAENTVADYYTAHGHQTKARRMKTAYGEVDLIMEKHNQIVFVEVKCSRTFAQAAIRITQRQIERIHAAAEDYMAKLGVLGLVDCRFDAAFVDANGRVEIVENAFI